MREDNDNLELNKKDEDFIFADEPEIKSVGRRRSRIDNNLKNGRKSKKAKKEKKPKKKMPKKVKIIIISVILLIIIAIGTVFGVYVYQADGDITEAVFRVATDVLGNDDPIFVLILGISEDISSELTDTIILAGYNPKTQQAFMLSIPRDTFIGKNEATAGGYDKINALYQKGVNKTIKAVESLTGVKIDNYAIVKNRVIPTLVDVVGEVEFDVPIDMNYDDNTQNLHIHLKKGLQKIDRNKAEQLLRFRHNTDGSSYPSEYGNNDYGRMKTQREFIKAVAQQLINVNDIGQLKIVAQALLGNLETDMSLTKAIGYIPYGLNFNVDNITMEQLPGSSGMLNNLSFYRANSSKTKQLMDELMEKLGLEGKEKDKHYTGKITVFSSGAAPQSSNKDSEDAVYTNQIDNTTTYENISKDDDNNKQYENKTDENETDKNKTDKNETDKNETDKNGTDKNETDENKTNKNETDENKTDSGNESGGENVTPDPSEGNTGGDDTGGKRRRI